jgi:uncharacterized membrane protein YhhN
MNYLIIAAALALLAGLLYYAKQESQNGQLMTKPFLSLLFIAAAMLQPHQSMTYYHLVLAGLGLCLIGDVCLIFFANRKVFTAGLVAFLAGHILYVIAFFNVGSAGPLVWATLVVCLCLSAGVFVWLRPHLGEMLGPVIAYIVIITAMVVAASSLTANTGIDMTARVLIFAGAVLFYVSDIFVARHRFVKKEFLNRAAGLPMYYAAQFMIAFSTGLI